MRGKIHDLHGKCQSARLRHFQCQSCGMVHTFSLRCNKRFEVECPDCSEAWKRKTMVKIKLGIENMKNPKFITLTLKKDVHLDVRRIWKFRNDFFHKLRRKGYRIRGWIAVCEWPNHIHIVADIDQYIPQMELSETWKSVTGDSYIVDIRKVDEGGGKRRAANYLSKYLGKSIGWEDANLSLLKGFHLQNNHGLCLDNKKKPFICECGYGCLIHISDMEFEHNQAHYVIYEEDT